MAVGFTGQEVQVGDTVAWAVGTRSKSLRIGVVKEISPQGMLKCLMATEGRGRVDAGWVVKIDPVDFEGAVGLTSVKSSWEAFYRMKLPRTQKILEDCTYVITDFDSDNYLFTIYTEHGTYEVPATIEYLNRFGGA